MKRVSGIEIYNFKNIKSAKLDFKNSMLGLYGENGSGKTALIFFPISRCSFTQLTTFDATVSVCVLTAA